ncbi:MAG: hypothetical protein ACC631_01655 [Halocynthiibacter sp.]
MNWLLAPTLAGLILAGAAVAGPQQVKIEVTGLTCPTCPYIAAQAIESVSSVQILDGVYDQNAQLAVFDVLFDDEVTTGSEVAAAVENYGYPARVLDGSGSGS